MIPPPTAAAAGYAHPHPHPHPHRQPHHPPHPPPPPQPPNFVPVPLPQQQQQQQHHHPQTHTGAPHAHSVHSHPLPASSSKYREAPPFDYNFHAAHAGPSNHGIPAPPPPIPSREAYYPTNIAASYYHHHNPHPHHPHPHHHQHHHPPPPPAPGGYPYTSHAPPPPQPPNVYPPVPPPTHPPSFHKDYPSRSYSSGLPPAAPPPPLSPPPAQGYSNYPSYYHPPIPQHPDIDIYSQRYRDPQAPTPRKHQNRDRDRDRDLEYSYSRRSRDYGAPLPRDYDIRSSREREYMSSLEYEIPPTPPPPERDYVERDYALPTAREGSFTRDRNHHSHRDSNYSTPHYPQHDYDYNYGSSHNVTMDYPADPYESEYHVRPRRSRRRRRNSEYVPTDLHHGEPEYEVEYQSAPPSRGKDHESPPNSASEKQAVPRELEYSEPTRKEIEYHTHDDEDMDMPPPRNSQRRIDYHRRDLEEHSEYYGENHPSGPSQETEYNPIHRPSTSHSKYRRSEAGASSSSHRDPEKTGLVLRPPSRAPSASTSAAAPRWPPSSHQTELSSREAEELIKGNAPIFSGRIRTIPGAPKGHYYFFVMAGKEWDQVTDSAMFQTDAYGDMSSATNVEEALERPAMCHAFGIYPGTITLSCYVSQFSSFYRDTNEGSEITTSTMTSGKVKVRRLSMMFVMDRLRHLQDKGIEENDPPQMHAYVYDFLLYEPRREYEDSNHRYSIEYQIQDLISALSRPVWIDFSILQNQTVSQFLKDCEPGVTNAFFHQLLLALELYLRVATRNKSKTPLPPLSVPEKVSWDLILAQRWLENVHVQAPRKVKEGGSSSISFGFKNKKNQLDAFKEFAWTLKWPNMHEVNITLSEDESEQGPSAFLEDRSINCMAWFTGLVLPGKSMPFIIMNALTDCDPDTPENFHNLSPAEPNVGFQFRGHSYWNWECIVGRVLGGGTGVKQITGWIGPCITSPDLDRCEVAKVNQLKPRNIIRLGAGDVENMERNSDPLGDHRDDSNNKDNNTNGEGEQKDNHAYPVDEYDLLIPDSNEVVDTIRIERLNFTPASNNPPGVHRTSSDLSGARGETVDIKTRTPIVIFDASITFAIGHRSWTVCLRYDTPFVAAYPCEGGPHVLHWGYKYRVEKIDELVNLTDWGPRTPSSRRRRRIPSGKRTSDGSLHYDQHEYEDGRSYDPREDEEDYEGEDENIEGINNDLEDVLVVEAFGVHDNEVFARAWCSFWGVSSIMGDLKKTCMACCIREAYACGISVVVLTDAEKRKEEVEEVDRKMEGLYV